MSVTLDLDTILSVMLSHRGVFLSEVLSCRGRKSRKCFGGGAKYLRYYMVGIAQLVRAPGCGPGGRGFKSHYSPQVCVLKGECAF